MNAFLVQESAGFATRGKYHIAREKHGDALCGTQPRMSSRWNVTGDRAEFERHIPERICKRCRAVEALVVIRSGAS